MFSQFSPSHYHFEQYTKLSNPLVSWTRPVIFKQICLGEANPDYIADSQWKPSLMQTLVLLTARWKGATKDVTFLLRCPYSVLRKIANSLWQNLCPWLVSCSLCSDWTIGLLQRPSTQSINVTLRLFPRWKISTQKLQCEKKRSFKDAAKTWMDRDSQFNAQHVLWCLMGHEWVVFILFLSLPRFYYIHIKSDILIG